MEFFAGELLGFIMIFTRVSAFIATAPIFSWAAIPIRIRLFIAIFATIFFAMAVNTPASADSIIEVTLLLANEAVYGIALGLSTMLLYLVVKVSAGIAENQMGMTMAEIMDPLTGERAQPLSMFMEILFILLLLCLNIHHVFLLTVSKSFESFPPGSIPSINMLTQGIIACGATMLFVSLKIALPLVGIFLLLTVILGIMARVAPEMNIFFLSFPIRIGLGLVMVIFFLPYINSYTTEFMKLLSKLLPL